MKCIVLAGGLAERLWPLTNSFPKVLLEIAGKPLIKYLLEKLVSLPFITDIYISIDDDKYEIFQAELNDFNVVHLGKTIQVKSHGYKNKLPVGPVQKIFEVVKYYNINDESIMVIGGDNFIDFDLNKFYKFYKDFNISCNAVNRINKFSDLSQYGIALIDNDKNISSFLEKPSSIDPRNPSLFISSACYIFTSEALSYLNEYLESRKEDNLGKFVDHLQDKNMMKAFKFSDTWFDVGNRSNLLSANAYTLSKLGSVKYPDIFVNNSIIWSGNLINYETHLNKSEIRENVYIGRKCYIENSIISNSIIYDNCKIRNSIITNCVIGKGSIIEGKISEFLFGPLSTVIDDRVL